jgi:hypothetical protein
VNRSALTVAVVPPPVVTVTSTVLTPDTPGETAVIDVVLLTVTLEAAVPPKLTWASDEKPVPVMVTDVPPVTGPLDGLIDARDGVYLNS